MPVETSLEELELTDLGGGGDGPGGEGRSRDDRGGDRPGSPGAPARPHTTGIWLALAAILMFFAALTSSLVVRRSASTDWVSFPMPRVLWLNTVILLASSGTLELARRARSRGSTRSFGRFWGMTTALGVAFLVGQLVAWRQLAAAGVYVATNPSSSFFYVLTGAHGVHLVGGVLALAYVFSRQRLAATILGGVQVSAIYWHFMGGLWVYILLLLQLGGRS